MPENPRIEELRRRVLADPASIAFAALAEEFRRVGALTDAIDTCRTGLLRHPAYLSARVTLGRALIETGEYDAAREEFETVLRSAPENLAAIRGLAQINERLGHSTEMDPDLAELMRQEAARVAALPPPAPVPEPVPEPLPEPVLEMLPAEPVPEPGPEIAVAPSEPEPKPEPEPDNVGFPAPSFQLPTSRLAPRDSRLAEPGPESTFAIEVESEAEPEPVFAIQLDPEPQHERAIDIAVAPDPGPDPQMLATLARLERFLVAVETARHA